jgi:hypothetical protein
MYLNRCKSQDIGRGWFLNLLLKNGTNPTAISRDNFSLVLEWDILRNKELFKYIRKFLSKSFKTIIFKITSQMTSSLVPYFI